MNPILEEFRQVAEQLTYRQPTVPIASNLTGTLTTDPTTPDYWVHHIREAVRFHDGITTLHTAGATTYLGLGPDTTLTALVHQTLDNPTAIPTQHPDLTTALAHLHTHGTTINWPTLLSTTTTTDLPTYPFQRKPYWIQPPQAGNASGLGLDGSGHALLGAALGIAGRDAQVLTGRISLERFPWLADHAVLGSVLLPGAAFMDLALHAASRAGCDQVEELTLEAPLVLPEQGAVDVQVVIGDPDAEGRRSLEVHSRAAAEREWRRHATGSLAVGGAAATGTPSAAWPPPDAVARPTEDLYPRLAGTGLAYGPVFQGVRQVWEGADGDLYAEVALDEETARGVTGFAVHPALLDSALHVLGFLPGTEGGSGVRLPFAWSEVAVHRTGAASVRVHVTATGPDSVALTLSDALGQPVLTVGSLTLRRLSAQGLAAARSDPADSLYELAWTRTLTPHAPADGRWALLGEVPAGWTGPVNGSGGPVEYYRDLAALGQAVSAGAPAPETVLVPLGTGSDGEVPAASRSALRRVLALVQAWSADERFSDTRLVLLTSGAVATGATGEPGVDPVHAAVWGLVRSAQTENPGRLVLLDADPAASEPALLGALSGALLAGEPQLAVRGDRVLLPRLVRLRAPAVESAPLLGDGVGADGTVLITGGTGALGAHLARHLVTRHGARRLLLVSRRGAQAPGAEELRAELAGQGAEIAFAACDLADPDAAEQLFAAAGPVAAIVHTAGVVADGLVTALTEDRLDAVLRPKIDAGWNLHRLAERYRVPAFVLYSSIAGVTGSGGQANYAAANAFLDALAQHRRAAGLPAVSLAWGLWAEDSALTGNLAAADRERMARSGLVPLSPEEGLELFDAALLRDRAVVVAARLDLAGVRARAAEEPPPALLRELVGAPVAARAATAAGTGPARDLAALPAPERERAVAELVRGLTAALLGHGSPADVEMERGFLDLGVDSLSALELRNRLQARTGLRLPSTLVFDHPTPAALVRRLHEELGEAGESADLPGIADLERLAASLAGRAPDDDRRVDLTIRLRNLLAGLETGPATAPLAEADSLRGATNDELFALIDNDLGIS